MCLNNKVNEVETQTEKVIDKLNHGLEKEPILN